MKEKLELQVEARTPGKHFSRALRRDSKVPAVVYGGKVQSTPILVNANAVKKYNVRAYENALFTFKSPDSKVNNIVALMKKVDIHPVSQKPLHVDFYAIDLTKSIRVSVEVQLNGKPIGLAEGGVLNVVARSVEIECLPAAIPENISVDIAGLGIGMAIHANDLQLPQGVKLISNPELTVCVVNKEEEKVAATPEATAAATPAATPAAGAKAPAAGGAAKAPAAGAKAPAAGGDKKK